MRANRKRTRIIWIASTVAILAAALVIGGLSIRQRANADAVAGQEIVTAFLGSLSAEASASGQLVPRIDATLSVRNAGRVYQVFVQTGEHVQAGDPLLQLEYDVLERAVRTAEQVLIVQQATLADLRSSPSEEEIAAARAAVESATAQLEEALLGPASEDIAAAEAAVESAGAQLEELLQGPGTEDLAQAKAALVSAQARERAEAARYAALDAQITIARQQLDIAAVHLENARYFYDALANDWQHREYAPFSPEAETLKDAQTAYAVAQARYDLAAANLNDGAYRSAQAQVAQAQTALAAVTGERSVEIASAREQLAQAQVSLEALTAPRSVQIASARSQLAQAQANLVSLLEGPSDEQILTAEARVRQAQIALQDARARLADTTVTAPFDGVVTALFADAGEWVSGPVVELIDTDTLEIVLAVDEVDIGQVALGQRTLVTLEAWPQERLEGEVMSIAPRGSSRTEVVTYDVHISLVTGDLPVRSGMTANADLITAERSQILLVANRAITADRDEGKYYVHRVEGDAIVQREVTVGLRDGTYTEITSGLEEGERLVVGYQADGFLSTMRTRFGTQ